MSNHSFAAMTQNSSSVLSKALGDPAVDQLARRLHIDLQDPATLNGLLAMTRQCVDGSAGAASVPKAMYAQASDLGPSHYERDAILSYQEIAAMV
ncbi:MAG: hypothetical protein D4R79_01755 [Comamonadaceae bacterium]|nr:hypothetical protein [Rhodoferax sp.]TSA15131.1 MAG: hypothetical protein D4R79_01755 [Comamonadaceae bacterium]